MLASTPPSVQLICDKGYDADHLRLFLQNRGTTPVIPNKINRKKHFPFDDELYRLRNVIERTFCRLKDFRAIATRYDKTARNFLAGLCLVTALCYWVDSVHTLVVIGTPVWAWAMSSPVRAYLIATKAQLRDVAFFCTLGGFGARRAFDQMQGIAGKTPRAVCYARQVDLESGAYRERVASFAEALAPATANTTLHGPSTPQPATGQECEP